MKKIILIMMCMVLAMTSYSKKGGDELEVKGFYIAETNVKFTVAIVNNDDSRVIVKTKSSTFSYKIKLKIGKEYVITFIKGDVVKKLFITADGPGYIEVDVDFATDDAAQLCYNEVEDDYHLTLLYKNE